MDTIAARRFAAKRDVFRSAEPRFAAKRVVFSATRSGKRAFRDGFGRTPSENNAFRGVLATGLWLYVAFRGVPWLPRPPRATDTGPNQRQQRHELAQQASNRPAAACQPAWPVRVRVRAPRAPRADSPRNAMFSAAQNANSPRNALFSAP